MAELIVVDAANVVGSRPDGWWRDRAAAAGRLVDDLERLDAGQVVVVLEGAARSGVEPSTRGDLTVTHARGSGDDEIVAVVRSALDREPDTSVTVVTSDRELRRRVEELGAHTHGPGWLRRQLG